MYIYIYIFNINIHANFYIIQQIYCTPCLPFLTTRGCNIYIYIYIVVIPIPYEPLAVNNEAGKLLLGGKYPKNFGEFFCSVLEAFHKGIPAALVLMHLRGFAFLHFAEVFLTGECLGFY